MTTSRQPRRQTPGVKGNQQFAATAKKQSFVGLDGIVVDTPDEYDYVQPYFFNGAPSEDQRFNVVNATAMNDSDVPYHLGSVLPYLSREQAKSYHLGIKEAWDLGAEATNSAVSAAMIENMTAQRKQDFLAINPGWTEPTVTESGGYTTQTGCQYDPDRDVVQSAKLVRHDIATAIKSGFLPEGDYSVRIQRYAGGRSMDIEAIIPGSAGDFHNLKVLGYEDRRIAWREVQHRINTIQDQYSNHTVAQGLSEGGRSNFSRHVILGFRDA